MDTKLLAFIGAWMTKRKSQTILVIAACVALLALVFVARDIWISVRDQGKLVVYALDVGQGDALFIRFPNGSTMLIDGGPDDRVLAALPSVLPFWERHIDTVLLTHPEADHVGGLPAVFERYTVGRVVMTGVLHTTSEYLQFLEYIRDTKTPVTIIDRPIIERIDTVRLEYVWPRISVAKTSVPELNATSIVLRIVYGETSFLFTGDSELTVEEGLIASGVELNATVLKVGHHGSDTSTTQPFLDAVRPTIALISAGRKNRFGHPSRRIIRRLERAHTTIHRTDREGTVRVASDGEDIE